MSEGKVPLVREEHGTGASSLPVVWQGIAGQPRASGEKLKASKLETAPEKRHLRALLNEEFDRVGM